MVFTNFPGQLFASEIIYAFQGKQLALAETFL
jgi:hypothetical protein